MQCKTSSYMLRAEDEEKEGEEEFVENEKLVDISVGNTNRTNILN